MKNVWIFMALFIPTESQVVPFKQNIYVIMGPEIVADIVHSGDYKLDLHPRNGTLTVRLDTLGEFKVFLNPNMKIPEHGEIKLKVSDSPILDRYNTRHKHLTCSASLQEKTYALICTAGDTYMAIPELPVWTLGKGLRQK